MKTSSHPIDRRTFLSLGLLAGAGCSGLPGRPLRHSGGDGETEGALRRGAEFLWSKQARDGGWHSRTYGLLRSGQSLTGFVLVALLEVPREVHTPQPARIERALQFLRTHLDGAGAVGRADPLLPDYPNYATSLALRAWVRLAPPDSAQVIPAMSKYLLGQQFTEQNGWTREHPAYGAWGMGGDRRTPPDPGHVDISMTRHVSQALSAAGLPANDPAFRKARVYVERCHNFPAGEGSVLDGGFYFSTVILDANKAGEGVEGGEGFRSYGTATADGILSLLALGSKSSHPRLAAARRWLEAHHVPDGAGGFTKEIQDRWTRGLRFYYAASASEALGRLGAGDQLGPLAEALAQEQRIDGGWSNPQNLVKEDDPLIATPFAVRALATRFSSP